MVMGLLLLFLVAQEPPVAQQPPAPAVVDNGPAAVDLRVLVPPPTVSVAETLAVTEARSRTKSLPGPKGSELAETSSTRQVYSMQVLQADEDNTPNVVLLQFTTAESTKGEKTTILPHQGKSALYQRTPDDTWMIGTYVLENDERKDVKIPLTPLQVLVSHFDNPRRNYDLLFAQLPEGPLQPGQTWPVEAKILVASLENLVGIDPDRSKLTLALGDVSDKTVTLNLTGQLVYRNGDEETAPKLVWEGQVSGQILLARGPFRELRHVFDVAETVSLTMDGKTVQGKGTYHLSREIAPAK